MSVALIAALALSTQIIGSEEVNTEILASGLDYPWAVAELPDGDFLITEKSGALRWIEDGVLRDAPVASVPAVTYSGQGGLLDIVLHPDYAENGWIYLTWSAGTQRDNTLKLGRGRFENGALVSFEEIFSAQPHRPTDVHYGGRLAFLDDGSLLLGIGDGFDLREQAQVPGNHYGTFVRLADDGTPYAPEVEGGAPGVYSFGHRNPQAIVFDAASGTIYAHEHGPRGGDEINILEAGGNYGWPIVSRGIDYTGALVTPFQAYAGMIDPLHDWTPSIAPSAMVFYDAGLFDAWRGDLLVTALISGESDSVSGHLRRIDLEGGQVAGEYVLLGERGSRLRDVFVASDGSVLVLTDSEAGQLLRLTPR